MAEKLGNWYIIKVGNILYKIDKKHVNDNCVNVKKYRYGREHTITDQLMININDIINVNEFYVTCKDNEDYFIKNRIITQITDESYINLQDVENMRKQIEKLTAHVQALMIKTESLPKDYDGEFP